MENYPLADVRVLDLSRVLAGPFAGRMLSDLGAEVVKVEPPDQDVTRRWGKRIAGIAGYFHQQNAGKKNISINLKHPKSAELLLSLAAEADILIENFRPGVMDKLGIGWETLHQHNPKLIMLSISGFGQGGPESGRAAYAPIIHAETGSIYRQAIKSVAKPVEMCMSFADTNAGLHGLVGILAALHQRSITGRGQHIDIAMVDAMIATDDQTHYHLEKVDNVENNASEVWDAVGGPIMIAGDFRHIWRTLTENSELTDPTPENASLEEKIRCRREALQTFLLDRADRDSLIQALDKANLAWGGVYNTGEYLEHSATLKHRHSIQEVDDRAGGTRPTFQSPYRFSESKSGVKAGSAKLGENNREILSSWLSLDSQAIAALSTDGIIVENLDPETDGKP